MYFNIEEMDITRVLKELQITSNNEYLIVDLGQPLEQYAQKMMDYMSR